MLSKSEIWKTSGILYREIILQSILSANTFATTRRKVEDIVRMVSLNMWLNKILMCIMLGIMAIAPVIERSTIGITVFLTMSIFIFIFLGMQAVTSFVALNFDYLRILPMSRKEVSMVNLMAFFRLFDLPLVLLAIFFPLAIFITTSSPLYAVFAFTAILVSEVFSLAMVFSLARLFYSKIAHSTGSKFKDLLRVLYIIVWCIPAFGFYFAAKFAAQMSEISSRYSGVVASQYDVLSLVFPFCFGFLIEGIMSIQLLGSCAAYVLLAAFALKWLLSSIDKISSGNVKVTRSKVSEVRIKPLRPVLGMVKKDLKLIFRTPSYAIVVMLPIFDSFFFAFDMGKYISIGTTITILSLMVIVSFILFSVEGSQYTQLLPINTKFIIKAKTVLAVMVYAVSVLATGIVLTFKGNPSGILLGICQIPAVCAMSLVMFTLAAKIGVRIDMHTGLTTAIILFIPGYAIAMLPLGIGLTMSILYGFSLELASFISSLVEMVAAIAILNVVRLEGF